MMLKLNSRVGIYSDSLKGFFTQAFLQRHLHFQKRDNKNCSPIGCQEAIALKGQLQSDLEQQAHPPGNRSSTLQFSFEPCHSSSNYFEQLTARPEDLVLTAIFPSLQTSSTSYFFILWVQNGYRDPNPIKLCQNELLLPIFVIQLIIYCHYAQLRYKIVILLFYMLFSSNLHEFFIINAYSRISLFLAEIYYILIDQFILRPQKFRKLFYGFFFPKCLFSSSFIALDTSPYTTNSFMIFQDLFVSCRRRNRQKLRKTLQINATESQLSNFIIVDNMSKFVHLPTLMFYRRLLKTMMKTFTGDYNMFHQCRIEARKKIKQSSQLRDPVAIQDKIFEGEEVRDFLEVNVMQGTLQESGNYRFKARPEHGVGAAIKDGTIK